jgi:hypothetical protein
MGISTFGSGPVEAVLVTRDHRQIPITVALPAPPNFTIHRADGCEQIFSLERSSLQTGGIVYVENTADGSSAANFLPLCPVCGGKTESVRDIKQPAIFACRECDTGVIVPPDAWTIAREKRELKWRAK